MAFSLLALVVAFAVFVNIRAGQNERAALAAYQPEGRFVVESPALVHAVVRGEGPDLVLIHGASGNAREFTFALMDRLSADYRVIAFDRPGLGWSSRLPRGQEGIHDQAARLREAAAALGADRPIVLGQSYGAAVALAWAVDAPDSIAALVSVSGPSHPWKTPPPLLYRINAHPIGSAILPPLITAFVGEARVNSAIAGIFAPQSPPEGYNDHIGAPLSLTRDALRANAVHRVELLGAIRALAPRYPELSLPIEIVHGTEDTTVSIKLHGEKLIRDTDMAHLTPLPGIGHMPHHAVPDAVVAAIHRAAERAGLR